MIQRADDSDDIEDELGVVLSGIKHMTTGIVPRGSDQNVMYVSFVSSIDDDQALAASTMSRSGDRSHVS